MFAGSWLDTKLVPVTRFPWPADRSGWQELQEAATTRAAAAAAGRCQMLLKSGKPKALAEMRAQQEWARDALGK